MRSIKKFFIVLLCSYVVCGQLGAMDLKHVGRVQCASEQFYTRKPLTGAQIAQGVFSVLKLSNLLVKREACSKKDFVGRLSLYGIRIICSILDIWNHPKDASYRYLLPWMALDVYRAIQDGRALFQLIQEKKSDTSGDGEESDEIFEKEKLAKNLKEKLIDVEGPSNLDQHLDDFIGKISSIVESTASFLVAVSNGDDELDRLHRKKWNGICSMSRLISELFDAHKGKEIRVGLAALLGGHVLLSYRDFDEHTKEEYAIEARVIKEWTIERAMEESHASQRRLEQRVKQRVNARRALYHERSRRRRQQAAGAHGGHAGLRAYYHLKTIDFDNIPDHLKKTIDMSNILDHLKTINPDIPAGNQGLCLLCYGGWDCNRQIVQTRCNHMFHEVCILDYVLGAHDHPNPSCRQCGCNV